MSINQIKFLFPGLLWEEHMFKLNGKEYKLFFARGRKALYCYCGKELIALPPV
jgi:hypothetical protein